MSDQAPAGASSPARHRSRSLRTHLRFLAATTAVLTLTAAGSVGGWWVAQQAADRHRATSVLLVTPLPGNPFSPGGRGDELVNLETEAQLVRSDAVAELVARDLGLSAEPSELLEVVSVDVPANTQLLRITAEAGSDTDARRLAQGFADTFLAYRSARTQSSMFDQLELARQQVKERVRERVDLVDKLQAAAPDSAAATLIGQQIVDLSTQIGLLRARASELEAGSLDSGQVITPASAAPVGLPGGTVGAAVAGGLVGAALGLLLVLAVARLDPRVRAATELRGDEVPLLGCVSADAGQDPAGVSGLRAALLAALPRHPSVLLTAGCSPRDDLPDREVVDALVRSLAAGGLRVAELELDGAVEPVGTAASLLDLLLDPSRSTALDADPDGVLRVGGATAAEHLDEVAVAARTGAVLQELRLRMDVVVLRGRTLASPLAQAAAAHTDLVLLQVHGGRTSRRSLWSAVQDARTWGAVQVSTVLVTGPGSGGQRWTRPGPVLVPERPPRQDVA
ncbi:hypothetical protein NOMA109596_15230 [Nocardioides marinus]|uniref:Capsular polysaccharide biosynthesis protein n=1 Tax=Nocardioides marinus TaxID=374514 RepID=A0A7Y9YJL1_9ACTN|nr:hypothetical protein [Nocardioides marinus]NYI12214.1 capsular polysaccharide biosynthesis protein [Nocardioides marinus]